MKPKIGSRIIRFSSLASTNDKAWELAAGPDHHGLVVVADSQAAGRGRRGTAWIAPPGSSLLLSIVLFHPLLPSRAGRRPVILTLWAALGVCEVIAPRLQRPVRMKWPNDVLVDERKVCGVLVEQRSQSAVVGVGLNVSIPPGTLRDAGLSAAASLSDYWITPLDRETLLAELIDAWNRTYEALSDQDPETLLHSWRHFGRITGSRVAVSAAGSILHGRLRRMTFEAVELETGMGTQHLVPESIQAIQILDEDSPPCSPPTREGRGEYEPQVKPAPVSPIHPSATSADRRTASGREE